MDIKTVTVIGVTGTMGANIAGNLLATQRKYYFQLFVAITSGILNFTADYFLVSKYGIEGAAVATLVVAVFTSLLNAGYLIRTLKRTDQ